MGTSGHPSSVMQFLNQFGALYQKNALVAWRARRATILRLLAPFLFLLLALLIDRAIQADDRNQSFFSDVKRPEAEALTPIPSCHEDVYIGSKDCIELAYSPNNAISSAIMSAVVQNNAKKIQPARGFANRQEVNKFLLENPDFAIAAVHFVFDDDRAPSPTLQGFVIQTNTTIKAFKSVTQDPNTFVQLPLQSAVHREIARYQLSQNPATRSLADQLSWYIGLKIFAHPTLATTSVLSRVLGPFVFAACMFSFVTQLSAVVMEKEMGLRQAMRTMGMKDSAYWLSWVMWEVTLAFIAGHLISIFGLILQFKLFLNNNYGLLFFLFFMFQLSMSSLALFIASFIKKTQTAVYVGFLIFIVGWIMQTVVIFGVPYTPDSWTTTPLNTAITVIFSAFPWNLLMKGFTDLGSATVSDEAHGIKWKNRARYCQNIPSLEQQNLWTQQNDYDPRSEYVDFKCVFPLDELFKVYIALWLGYMVLAVYFDNVVKNEFGVSRPWLYFLYPSYWLPSTVTPSAALHHVLKEDALGPAPEAGKDEDVLAEEARIKALLNHRTGHTGKEGELAAAVDVRNAIEVYGLKKQYGGSNGCYGTSLQCPSLCSCCSCIKQEAFWPIKGTWLAIEQNQLFCLLGPNGAGKTTTINCLTGVMPPTYGDALVYGQSIKSTGGMDKIRSLMGVCPQFDVLWPELSGREHLVLYGRIKGYGWNEAVHEADALLDKVKLAYAAEQHSGAYSGGMKRRLSVAIALLGDPKVVYLDEPTTGMDPISRRYVWDIIQEAKVGRAIVLTTHSMEEADILGDRIAIMALGRLRCLGTALRLKQRFGSGYQVSISVQPGTGIVVSPDVVAQREVLVQQLFKTKMGLVPSDVGKSYTTYLVPSDKEPLLVAFLSELEQQQATYGITDIQLSLTSLEEVFLNIAKQAALDAAQARPAGVTGGRSKPLPFFTTCGKAALLGLTLPCSIFFVKRWGRWLSPKDQDTGDVATLPDGTTIPVQPGQGTVVDADGQLWQVVWGVDDSGNLVVQDTKPASAAAGAAAASVAICVTAQNGKALVPLPGNVLMEVRVGDAYVMNPSSGTTYHVVWGKDAAGHDAVVACSPIAAQGAPVPQDMNGSAAYMPVAMPYGGQYGMPGQVDGYAVHANGRPVGESVQLPGAVHHG